MNTRAQCEAKPDRSNGQRFPRRIWLITFAGWMFDFYDLVLFSFLLIPVGQDLRLTESRLWIERKSTHHSAAAVVRIVREQHLGVPLLLGFVLGVFMLGTILVSAVVANYGFAGGLTVPLALALATAAWVWTLPETRQRDLAQISPDAAVE